MICCHATFVGSEQACNSTMFSLQIHVVTVPFLIDNVPIQESFKAFCT